MHTYLHAYRQTHTHTHTDSCVNMHYYKHMCADVSRVFQAVDSINQARFATAFADFQLLLPGRGGLNSIHSMAVNRDMFGKRTEKTP